MQDSSTDDTAKRVSLIRKDVLTKLIQKIDYYDNQIDNNVRSSKELKTGNQPVDNQTGVQRISMSSDKVSECHFNNDSIIKAHKGQQLINFNEATDQKIADNSHKSESDTDNDSYNSFDKDIVNSNYNRNDPNVNHSESEFNCENGKKHKARSTLKRYKSKAKNFKIEVSKRSRKSSENTKNKRAKNAIFKNKLGEKKLTHYPKLSSDCEVITNSNKQADNKKKN